MGSFGIWGDDDGSGFLSVRYILMFIWIVVMMRLDGWSRV